MTSDKHTEPPIYNLTECPACNGQTLEKHESRVSCSWCGWVEWKGNNQKHMERWECYDCGHGERSDIGELAGRLIKKTVGEGRRTQVIEMAVCPECKSENWHSESVRDAFFGGCENE